MFHLFSGPGSPSLFHFMAEWRAPFEMAASAAVLPWLRQLPRGDGHPVLVLPGLAADDMTTKAMRLFLRDRGYRVYGWKMGRNVGYRPGMRAMLNQRLHYIQHRNRRKVSLIGWSLGGTYARQMAADMPDAVRQIVTLGTPSQGDPMSGHAWRLYEFLSGQSVDELRKQLADLKPITQPLTAIYSRTDGMVPWQRCRQTPAETVENVEIDSSHYGLGHHPMALYVIADRLAQGEGDWSPFDAPSGFCRFAFPNPDRGVAA